MSWVREAAYDWSQVTQGVPAYAKLGARLKPIVEKHTWPVVRPAWQRYLKSVEPRFLSAARFTETFGAWTHEPEPKDPTVIRSGESLDQYQARLAAL